MKLLKIKKKKEYYYTPAGPFYDVKRNKKVPVFVVEMSCDEYLKIKSYLRSIGEDY